MDLWGLNPTIVDISPENPHFFVLVELQLTGFVMRV